MRATLGRRALAFALLFVAVGASTAVNVVLVHAHGLERTASAIGGLLQIPALLALALVAHVALTRVKKMPREATGLSFRSRDPIEVALAWCLGVATVAACAGVLTVSGVAPFHVSEAPPSALVIAGGVLAFAIDAACQQVALQSFSLALAPGDRATPVSIALASLLFTLSHVAEGASPLYLANVWLFGVLTCLVFAVRARPSYAASIGLHAGWNFAYVFALGAPVGGIPHVLGVLRWPGESSLLSGGAHGLDAGLLHTIVVALACAIAAPLARGIERPRAAA